MSNLHLLLDEANKHNPKGFDPAINNTFPWKDELGLSTYREQMELPKAINFVDGTVAAPTTVDGDIYVLTGSGVIDGSWGNATFGDWVRFTNTIATEITPLTGYLCYDVTAASWMEYDGAVWAVFGSAGVVSTIFTGGTMSAPSTILMASNDLTFDGGQTTLKGPGATSGTTALLVENSASLELLKIRDDGDISSKGTLRIGALGSSLISAEYSLQIHGRTNTIGDIARFCPNNSTAAALDIKNKSVGVGMIANYATALIVKANSAAAQIRILTLYASDSVSERASLSTGGKFGLGQWGTDRLVISNIASAGWVNVPASTTAHPQMYFEAGVAPTSPNNGAFWFDGTDFKARIGGVTKTFTLT